MVSPVQFIQVYLAAGIFFPQGCFEGAHIVTGVQPAVALQQLIVEGFRFKGQYLPANAHQPGRHQREVADIGSHIDENLARPERVLQKPGLQWLPDTLGHD